MSRIKSILLLTLFLLTVSCSVHTFTYGDGPSQGYTKVLKQQNYLGGLISDVTPAVDELNYEKDYKLVIKHSIVDAIFSILSFGLYTPTTIIIYR